MANIIKIKRGLSSDIDTAVLELGELAITTDTNKLYVGSATGVPQPVVTLSKEEVQEMIDVTTGSNYDGNLSKYTTKWTQQDISSTGVVIGTNYPKDLSTIPDLWVRQNITTGGAIVSDASTSYNASNVMLINPIADTVTITIPTGLMYAQVLYNADGSFASRGSWNSTAGTIVWSAGDGYQNFTIATNGASSLTKEEMLAKFTMTRAEGYEKSAISLIQKEQEPMTVEVLTNTVEYAIVKYDSNGAFVEKSDWISGIASSVVYDNKPGYQNIVVRSIDGTAVDVETLLDRISIVVDVPDVEYATVEYVDEAIASIDIPEVDFTGYATEEYVNTQIDNIDFPETDLTPYSTTNEVKEMIEVATGDNFTGILNQYPSMWIYQNNDTELTLANTEKGPLSVLVNAPALAHTKQLLDANNATIFKGYSNGVNYLASNAHRIVYISCEPSTTYTVSGTTEGWISTGFYCSDAEPVANGTCSNINVTGVTENGRTYFTVTTDSTANYLAVMYYNANKTNTQTETQVLNDLMIGLGSDRTEYYSYQMTGIEYSIATYDGLNNFVSQSAWMQGDGIAHEYTSTGYLNIILRNIEGGEIDKDIALGKVYITVPVEEYATKEYVDSTFGKIHIGTEAPTDESVYLWIDTTEDNIITFTIADYSYNGMMNMTWGEWQTSDFNRAESYAYGRFYCNEDNTISRNGGNTDYFIQLGDTLVLASDVIIPNTAYTLKAVGSGGGSND